MKAELEKLIDLQLTDTNIRKLKKAIETVPERRVVIEQEFEQRASSIREIESKRDVAKNEKLELEKQIAEAKHNLEKADHDLKNSQNQKQYEASMRAMDVVQKQLNQLETEVLEKMGIIEEVEGVLAERAEEINSFENERQTTLNKFDSVVVKQKSELEKESSKREKVFKTLPPNMANTYNRLVTRSKDGIAVAEVKNNSCSSCFMSLRPQIVVDIKMGERIVTCESCTRILYILPKAEATA